MRHAINDVTGGHREIAVRPQSTLTCPAALPAVEPMIGSADDANNVVRRIVAARRYAERVKAWAAVELRRAERREQHLLSRYGPHLERWAAERLARRGGRARSVDLPAGRVGFRRTPPHVVVADSTAARAWCSANLPEALRTTLKATGDAAVALAEWHATWSQGHADDGTRLDVEVATRVLQQHFAESGEVPDGIGVVAGRDRCYVA